MKNNQGIGMIAVILIILGAIIVGGGIGAGVYYTQKKGTEQTNTGSNLANATPTIPGNTDQENPATSGNGVNVGVTNLGFIVCSITKAESVKTKPSTAPFILSFPFFSASGLEADAIT